MRRIAVLVAVVLAATAVPAVLFPHVAFARPNGATRVADIFPGNQGAYPDDIVRFGDHALFAAEDGSHGNELWTTDGTSAGTEMVKDINPGSASSFPSNLVVFGDLALFLANDGTHGLELWKTDGTPTGTSLVKDINPGSADAFIGATADPDITVFGAIVLFTAYNPTEGAELWRTDGSTTGTALIDVVPGGNSFLPQDLTVFGNVVLLNGDTVTNGTELFKTDGTVAGTSMVKDVPGSLDPHAITPFGNIAVFSGSGPDGVELWKTDGTDVGTVEIRDINGSGDSDPTGFTAFGGVVLFQANESATGQELWKTNGTTDGTVLVKDIATGTGVGSVPHDITVLGSKALFVAAGDDGAELWSTDGTPTNTVQVKDIFGGASGSQPTDLTVFGTVVVFGANDGAHGREPWASNGTSSGTSMIADVSPDTVNGSDPVNFLDFGSTALFNADNGVDGPELFRTVTNRVPGAPTIGTATAGNASATVTFTPPASTGGSPITSYTVTSTPGNITKTGTGSPITVTGLANGTSYRFTVHATNAVGNGPESALSNAVTPAASTSGTITVVQPNGGEHIARGTAYTIKWTYTGSPGTTVKILLLKSGTAVQTIASSQAIGSAGAGQRSWTPPTSLAAAATYKIKIAVNGASPAVVDVSNNTFSLT